jgi:hypothetical protein
MFFSEVFQTILFKFPSFLWPKKGQIYKVIAKNVKKMRYCFETKHFLCKIFQKLL